MSQEEDPTSSLYWLERFKPLGDQGFSISVNGQEVLITTKIGQSISIPAVPDSNASLMFLFNKRAAEIYYSIGSTANAVNIYDGQIYTKDQFREQEAAIREIATREEIENFFRENDLMLVAFPSEKILAGSNTTVYRIVAYKKSDYETNPLKAKPLYDSDDIFLNPTKMSIEYNIFSPSGATLRTDPFLVLDTPHDGLAVTRINLRTRVLKLPSLEPPTPSGYSFNDFKVRGITIDYSRLTTNGNRINLLPLFAQENSYLVFPSTQPRAA